jgi:large subunit ribosomal protein L35
MKTNKSALKRIKKKKYFFARKSAFKSHLLEKKSTSRLIRLKRKSRISCEDFPIYKKLV